MISNEEFQIKWWNKSRSKDSKSSKSHSQWLELPKIIYKYKIMSKSSKFTKLSDTNYSVVYIL